MSDTATPERTDWEKASVDFLDYLEREEKSDLTIKEYAREIWAFHSFHFNTFDSEPSLKSLSALELREYKRYLMDTEHLKAATVNKRLASLSSFLRWAQSEGLAEPIKRPKSMPVVAQPPRWLNRRDRLAFLRACERACRRDRAIGLLYFHTGARVHELAQKARWRDLEISQRKGSITLHGKGAKDRVVPLNAEARRALTDLGYPGKPDAQLFTGQRGPMGVRGVQDVVVALAEAAKVDATCHTLRHTFCRQLAEGGARLEEIATLAGHSSLETTRRYLTPGKEELAAAVERLAGGDD